MIKIDKDVPLPDDLDRRVRRTLFPFDEMEVGDSFLCTYAYTKVVQAALSWGRKQEPRRWFVTRQLEDGVRCWRTE